MHDGDFGWSDILPAGQSVQFGSKEPNFPAGHRVIDGADEGAEEGGSVGGAAQVYENAGSVIVPPSL